MTSEVLNHMMPTNITKVNIRNGTIKPTDKLLSSSFAIKNFFFIGARYNLFSVALVRSRRIIVSPVGLKGLFLLI